jgi:hypothetical protein
VIWAKTGTATGKKQEYPAVDMTPFVEQEHGDKAQ